MTDREMTVVGDAGSPNAVATSNSKTEENPGAGALGEDKPGDKKESEKPKLTGARRRLPPPTSTVEEKRKKKENKKKDRPPNININQDDTPKEKEDNKLKQPTLQEFASFTKKKITAQEENEEISFLNAKDPNDKSREATSLEVFSGFCHMEERFHEAIKANDNKWKAIKRVDENRIGALTKMVRSQAKRLTQLETSYKKLMEGSLTEVMEILRQINGGEFKKTTNIAENDLRNAEKASKAAQDELDIWANEEDFVLGENEDPSNKKFHYPFVNHMGVRTPLLKTPSAPPATPVDGAAAGPGTPKTNANQNGKAKANNNQPGKVNARNKNKNDKQEQSWADIMKLNIPNEVKEVKDPQEYAQRVAAINNIVPNHVHEESNRSVGRPKVDADMEKIASVIGIKNINWSETRTHAVGHEKNKGDANREILAKSRTFAEARVRYAILHLNAKMGIPFNQLPITEAWSASNVDSRIMWVKADRKTIAHIKHVKAEAHRQKKPLNIEFMEWTPGNHKKIREEIKERCERLKEFNKHWWVKVVPGAPGSPNYQIEVSHSYRKKFIKTNYDLFMKIPLDKEVIDIDGPHSGEKKLKKRTRLEQHPDDEISYRDLMKNIESQISDAYEEAYEAFQGSASK